MRLLDYGPGCRTEPDDTAALCAECNACERCSPGPRVAEVCDDCQTQRDEGEGEGEGELLGPVKPMDRLIAMLRREQLNGGRRGR